MELRLLSVGARGFFSRRFATRPRRSILSPLARKKPLAPRIVPRQIKPGILKLATGRDQNNFSIVFIFVSCEEKKPIIVWFQENS